MDKNVTIVIEGTGPVQSILAAKLALQGKKVVHIDQQTVYGGSLAALKPGLLIKEYQNHPKTKIYINNQETKSLDASFLANWNIYLAKIPKIMYCSGPLIQEIIHSGCHSYLEFQKIDKMFYQTTLVPHTKEDIFSNESISLIDKRKLMKFMTFMLENEPTEVEGTFFDFLKEHQVPSSMIPVFLYAICLMRNEKEAKELSASQGLAKLKRHFESFGQYGKMSWLTSQYGLGSEICQAFCRLSAVHGTIYATGPQCHVKKEEEGYRVTLDHETTFIAQQRVASLGPTNDMIQQCVAIGLKKTPFLDGLHSFQVEPPSSSFENTIFSFQTSVDCGYILQSITLDHGKSIDYLSEWLKERYPDMELLLLYPVSSFPKHQYAIENDTDKHTVLVSDDSVDFALDDALDVANTVLMLYNK